MAIVRTGVAWYSLVCWLVILIGAGSSEVGAQSAPVGQKRGARACKVTGGRGPHVSRARGRQGEPGLARLMGPLTASLVCNSRLKQQKQGRRDGYGS